MHAMQQPTRARNRLRWLGVLGALALLAAIAVASNAGTRSKPAAKQLAAAKVAAPRLPESAQAVERFQIPVTRSQPSRGPSDAIVTIVEWCDLSAGPCAKSDAMLEQVLARSGGRARRVFRHFAQPTRGSQLAHQLARIGHEQAGKFWEARALMSQSAAEPTAQDIERYTAQLGLDPSAVRAALERGTHAGHVTADRVFAQMFGVYSAPALFVNGRRLAQPFSLAALQIMVDDELAYAEQLVGRGVPKEQVYAELTKNGTWQRAPTRSN
jgi:protein-disulfide isomerase